MALDITLLFKATVKTVKVLNKAIGVGFHSPKDDISKQSSSSRTDCGFSPEAKEVITNITKLKDFLLQHRKAYVNARSLVSSDLASMTDGERDKIDQDAQIFMRTCSEAIKQLRAQSEKQLMSAQMRVHRGAVLDMAEAYLRGVCKLYSEQRAIRFKRVVDKKRLSRLQPEHHSMTQMTQKSHVMAKEKGLSEVRLCNSADPWGEEGGVEDELSPEEIQTYEQENQRLVRDMSGMVDECRHIEGSVAEISRLQEIFSENVLQQETEIDSIHQLVVDTTETVKEGNKDIREAMRNNGSLRLWILFFLVMCSLSLLFLDWYSG